MCRGVCVFWQAAAEEVARAHPIGIDFLIVNAAIVDAEHKSGIETCGLTSWLALRNPSEQHAVICVLVPSSVHVPGVLAHCHPLWWMPVCALPCL